MRKKKRIVIFGAHGLLGKEFVQYLQGLGRYHIFPYSKNQCDITDARMVCGVVRLRKPDIIINCAALINVEYCEQHPLEAWMVNAIGPGIIARTLGECGLSGATFVHISTSDVFGSDKKKFSETDIPHPVNTYGWSKFAGEKIIEQELKQSGVRYYILRASWLYGEFRDTFVAVAIDTLQNEKSITAICDQYSVVTSAHDFVEAGEQFLRSDTKYMSGIYHIVNDTAQRLSKYTILRFIADALKKDPSLVQKTSRKNIFRIARPASAFLVNKKFKKLPDWKISLRKYIMWRKAHVR